MDGNTYQEKAHSFATKGGDTLLYALLGAIEECGELCEKVTFVRSSDLTDELYWLVRRFIDLSKEIGKKAKMIRKDWDSLTDEEHDCVLATSGSEGIDKEVGDNAWMLANVAHHLGFKMDDILEQNIAKLEDRQKRNVIIGNGDNR